MLQMVNNSGRHLNVCIVLNGLLESVQRETEERKDGGDKSADQ
jgi:hypothetical protein